mgnify:CR=1 FL=1
MVTNLGGNQDEKKILGVLLAVGIIAGVIAGCGNSNTTQNGAENASQASATAKARTLDEIKKSGKIKLVCLATRIHLVM